MCKGVDFGRPSKPVLEYSGLLTYRPRTGGSICFIFAWAMSAAVVLLASRNKGGLESRDHY
jgi:hypothetical protein